MSTIEQLISLLAAERENLTNKHKATLRKLILPNAQTLTPTRQGYCLNKVGSSTCSPAQRKLYLGAKGSLPLTRIPEAKLFSTPINQIAISTDGSCVYTHSDNLDCKAKELDEFPYVDLEDLNKEYPRLRERMGARPLSKLTKNLSSRRSQQFKQLPVDADGCLLLDHPMYPNKELSPWYLEAMPFQQALYTLKVDWYTRHGRYNHPQLNRQYLILADDFQVALLPLSLNK